MNDVFNPEAEMTDTISFKLNGKPTRLNVDGNRLLLWVLRTDLGLTGPKFGCGAGTLRLLHGAGEPCGVALLPHRGQFGQGQGSRDHRRSGTGRKTASGAEGVHGARRPAMRILHPGQVLNAVSLLNKNPQPTREQIVQGMNNNFCRCGAHTRIIDAIQSAAAEMKGGPAQ